MNTLGKLAASAGAGTVFAGLLAGPVNAAPANHARSHHPVFVQTDNPSGNTVVAYDRSGSGRLTPAGSYATGGLGGVLSGSVVDHTASQGALAYDARAKLLYAVNAGSNSITVFAVHGDQLVRQQVLWSGGTFPVSVTIHDERVYVLNARSGGSVQGYVRFGSHLERVAHWNRSLGLPTNLSPEFANTPAEITFSPRGDRLLVSTKNGDNSILVFRAGWDGPSAMARTSIPQGVPFGMVFDRAGHLAVAEAGPNAVAVFALQDDGALRPLQSLATGQAGTCWIVRSGDKVYVSNAGSATLSEVSVSRDGELSGLGLTATGAGTVDAAVSSDGRNLYVQTGAAGDIDQYQIQHDGSLLRLGSLTVPNAEGAEGIVAP